MFDFVKTVNQKQGTIYSMLCQCYKQYFSYEPGCEAIWKQSWLEYDKLVFNHPDTIGACAFFTRINKKIIGFASWDPREYPRGVIGHNCILPEFSGNSYGTQQIKKIIQILRSEKFESITAKTGTHLFFEPARKMYRACGFKEITKNRAEGCSKYGTVVFEYKFR